MVSRAEGLPRSDRISWYMFKNELLYFAFFKPHYIFIPGTKSDLRNSPGAVQQHEGEKACRQLNGNAYLECSAKSYTFINEVIHAAVRAVQHGVPQQVIDESDSCCSWNPFACCF